MRLAKVLLGSSFFALLLALLFFFLLLMGGEESGGKYALWLEANLVSEESLQYKELVEKYAKEYGISEYVHILLAIIEVESGGRLPDVMQSSESMGLPPNTITDPEVSIRQGCQYFASLVQSGKAKELDQESILQAYNFGSGFLDYVKSKGGKYRYELAENFAKNKAKGQKMLYSHPIVVKQNGGWRYAYGNQFYVALVSQYVLPSSIEDKQIQLVMKEALKYQGYKYVFGGESPKTSFDCSGLTRWCYAKAGISLPRTAQEQYEATLHRPYRKPNQAI